jgi:hypothetical protein
MIYVKIAMMANVLRRQDKNDEGSAVFSGML